MQAIRVHPLTDNPTEAWRVIREKQKYIIKLKVKVPATPQNEKQVRFVCMSDTHSLIHNILFDIPDGDVFIHAGDFSRCGHLQEIEDFNNWIGTLPHKYKIVICGNHELTFDQKFADVFRERFQRDLNHRGHCYLMDEDNGAETYDAFNVKQYLTNCIYLQDSAVELYGIKIYGSPWQPEFAGWGFNLKRGKELLDKWNLIPEDTDVLITHTPPLGHGDLVCSGVRAGCVELLETVQQRIKPKYHVFGHIHEGYGVSSDGKIIYINASTCDINYMPNNPPVVFDFPIPDGHAKS